jgi:hypothetical protein
MGCIVGVLILGLQGELSMHRDKLDYEKIIKEMWKENAKEVPFLIKTNDTDTLKQIHAYSDRFDESPHKVKEKILADQMFANCFARNPARQTSHEKIAFEYLSKHNSVLRNFRKLPQNGNDAVYLTSDGTFQKYDLYRKKVGKAIDFYWENEDNIFYASHKYTRESGGAQDNQFREQKELLEKFRNNENENEYFFAICDGQYYTSQKMQTLKKLRTDRSFVLRIEDVFKTVCSIVKQ